MRTTQFPVNTQRETPSDAEIMSHQLMIRAGLIRKVSTGLYNWLPYGLRVLRKVEAIVREEMNKAGAIEVLMPVVQPTNLWEESGRLQAYGPELLRFNDRHERGFCMGPTHEEIITDLVRQELHSYKQLPINYYQIQTKFRDEIRPRFGVMRAREFTMKDAYSFHIDQASLEETYDTMYQTYCNIFTRLGLDFRPVLADTGSIGGSRSHEFHVLADTGEDALAISDGSEFAANVELAEATFPESKQTITDPAPMTRISTPNAYSIQSVCDMLSIPVTETVKTLIVLGSQENSDNEAATTETPPLIALVLRGDHKLNEIKAGKHPLIQDPVTFADEETIQKKIGCKPGSIGPCELDIPILVDRSAAVLSNFTCGANEDDYHYQWASWQRDAQYTDVADLREVVEGDLSPDGEGKLIIKRGIEVGHIFQLGEKYSEAMKATVLDENGKKKTLTMGCYGIGISRIVAAAIEQHHDEQGIIWPESMAPFEVAIIPLNAHKSETVRETAQTLYDNLKAAGIDVLLDDRQERPGVKFADCELIGIPHRVVISDKTLDQDNVEYMNRKIKEKQAHKLETIQEYLQTQLQ